MAIFRQYIAPFLIVLVFLVALLSVSARIFLPADMAAPAPIEGVGLQMTTGESAQSDAGAALPAALSSLIRGLPEEPALLGRF